MKCENAGCDKDEYALQNMASFLRHSSVTARVAEAVQSNPHMPDFEGDHWLVHLECDGREMRVHFSKGYGHHGELATASEVLRSLASDAVAVENAPLFDDWCAELGYDMDSRKAEATFQTCLSQAVQLRQLLGAELYETLLYHTECG